MTQLFISPHLDDVALSCGGYVHRLTGAGEEIVVASVCTADLPRGLPLSPAALNEHRQWQLGDTPYQLRCLEDDRAAARLKAAYVHMGLLDAIYRCDESDQPLYEGKDFMAGAVHPVDWQYQYPALLDRLDQLLQTLAPQRIFCPLSAGGHVDHIIVRHAAEQLCSAGQVAYYEDYPYAQKDPAAIARALQNPDAWRSTLVELTPEEAEARVAAVACYNSQLSAVFGDAQAMPAMVREYIASTGGERYWERV